VDPDEPLACLVEDLHHDVYVKVTYKEDLRNVVLGVYKRYIHNDAHLQ